MLEEHQTLEEILGESGPLKQLTKRLIERALAGELNYHLNKQAEEEKGDRHNGYSKKTVQCELCPNYPALYYGIGFANGDRRRE